MCGISGIFDTSNRPLDTAPLARMVELIRHRGPDDANVHTFDRTAFGHARLSIIDIAGGRQPVFNEDGSVAVIFNGEIFNYVELRAALIEAGHLFSTRSDTEVIVHLYEEHGVGFVNQLNGQFAIALYDKRSDTLILARDRAGILPLFYKHTNQRLLFCSEIKGILAAEGRKPELNIRALDQILTFWSPISPETIFQGVLEVVPGELIIFHDNHLKRHRYWEWSFPDHGRYRTERLEELSEELQELLEDAVRIRLRADVPVVAYLSGGLDSSIISALIADVRGTPPRTFSIGFDDPAFDETPFQQEMASYLGASHSHLQCSSADFPHQLTRTIWHTESPIIRTAPIPMAMLSSFVRDNGFKVVLTGEGSDEVFGGYDLFKEAKVRRFWAKNTASRLRPLLLTRLYPYLTLPRGSNNPYLASFFGVGLEQPEDPFFSHLPRWLATSKCKQFYSDDLTSAIREEPIDTFLAKLPPAFNRWHPFNRAQYIESTLLMPGYLLSSQGDRMLMANSVEGRFPFLDHRVIEFANSLHPNHKMKAMFEKYILRKAFANRIPPSILGRHKQPYRAPGPDAFLNGTARSFTEEMLSPGMTKRCGYYNPIRVQHLLRKLVNAKHVNNTDNMSFIAILSTHVWHHLFVEQYSSWSNKESPGDMEAQQCR